MRALLGVLVVTVGCGGSATSQSATSTTLVQVCPDGTTEIEPGIAFREIVQEQQRIWLYTPCSQELRGLVLVPPAGSNLLTGMSLGEGDRPEHLPYARAGYAVVSFDIAGPLESESDEAFYYAVVAFMRDEGGITSATRALDRALAEIPGISEDQIYAAGHSSAGTLVLLFAAHEERIRAVVAHAPVANVYARFADAVPNFEAGIPGYGEFLQAISPISHVATLQTKPVFLFHALGDRAVAPQETQALLDAMPHRHPRTIRVTTQGDHYEPMLREGIPQAIDWLETL